MPGRWTALGIVVFWLAMTAWLVGRELWMRFGPPPRLEDSLKAAANDGPTRWSISYQSAGMGYFERIGWAETQVFDQAGGGYQLRQQLHLDKASSVFDVIGLPWLIGLLPDAAGMDADAKIQLDLAPNGELQQLSGEVTADEGRYLLYRFVGKPEGPNIDIEGTSPFLPGLGSGTFRHDSRNIIQTSLCPLDRMPGLWHGRRWQVPLVDPAESLKVHGLQRSPVDVVVLDEPSNFHWAATRDWVSCFIVEADQPEQDLHIQIWVHQVDGRVLKQRARWGSLTLEIERKTLNDADLSAIAKGSE
jgi:hypothetical protein